ncbi:MAG: PDZ domain-containing protein [Bacteroidales bacterium]
MKFFRFSGVLGGLFLTCTLSWGVNPDDTRMLAQPALSADHIAFVYANDLWVANRDGSDPRRLTVDEGRESWPVFSPDGRTLAFSAEYDGNTDVFTVPVEGGVPTRLTWHPSPDKAQGFTPDGSAVLFLTQRTLHTNRYAQLYTVPLTGGFPEELVIPNAADACYSPDGSRMVYNPNQPVFRQWKNYRGGTQSVLWIFSFADNGTVEIPRPAGGGNDVNPMWSGNKIYFLSDRTGEFNLYVYDVAGGGVEQLTRHADFPILSASLQGNTILYEQAGYLHTYDIASGASRKLTVGIAADLLELRPRYVKGPQYIRAAHISPSGVRAVFDFRGDIVTVPADKGDARNLTHSTDAHETYPAWSPDGQSVAYFSDVSGEVELHIGSQDGLGPVKTYSLKGTGFYAFPSWSPDGTKIAFVDNGRNLYVLDVASGGVTRIDQDEHYVPGPYRNLFSDWSSDSKWIAYTKLLDSQFHQVRLYSVDGQTSHAVSDGLSDVDEPCFDRGGKYLYYFASTDAGPVLNWFDQSSADMEMTRNIYLVTLSAETTSPFRRESDEEEVKKEEAPEAAVETKGRKNKKEEATGPAEDLLRIDLEGILERIVPLPVKAGDYGNLASADDHTLLFIKAEAGKRMLVKYDLKEQKEEDVTEMDGFVLSADGKKMLFRNGPAWTIVDAGQKPNGKGMLKIQDIQVKMDPAEEWPQIFDETWRVNRDYFYDPGMHGADWTAMKEKYADFLPDLATRDDLNRVIQWMCSELSVGHHRGGGGDRLGANGEVGVGLLGANFAVENNRYRITRIFPGLNWNPELRSPLTEPGLNVKEGEYLLAVDGEPLTAATNLYAPFENTVGKIVVLTVGPSPDGSGSRDIRVEPVGDESALRNRAWVEGNLPWSPRQPTESGLCVRAQHGGSRTRHFKRYFFPQANRQAIIVDERYSNGADSWPITTSTSCAGPTRPTGPCATRRT